MSWFSQLWENQTSYFACSRSLSRPSGGGFASCLSELSQHWDCVHLATLELRSLGQQWATLETIQDLVSSHAVCLHLIPTWYSALIATSITSARLKNIDNECKTKQNEEPNSLAPFRSLPFLQINVKLMKRRKPLPLRPILFLFLLIDTLLPRTWSHCRLWPLSAENKMKCRYYLHV